MKILLISTDANLADKISTILHKTYATSPNTISSFALDQNTAQDFDGYDLIMLSAPKGHAQIVKFIKTLRENDINTPIAVIDDNTPDPTGSLATRFLNASADAYLNDPIHEALLPARIQSIMSRSQRGNAHKQNRIQIGKITLNLQNQALTSGQNVQILTPAEFACFNHMAKNLGRIISYHALRNITAPHQANLTTTLETLREKIAKLDPNFTYIQTHLSKGFSVQDPDAQNTSSNTATAPKNNISAKVIYPNFGTPKPKS